MVGRAAVAIGGAVVALVAAAAPGKGSALPGDSASLPATSGVRGSPDDGDEAPATAPEGRCGHTPAHLGAHDLCEVEARVASARHVGDIAGVSFARLELADIVSSTCGPGASLVGLDPEGEVRVAGAAYIPASGWVRLVARPGGTWGTHVVVAAAAVGGDSADLLKSGNNVPRCSRDAWRPGQPVELALLASGDGALDELLQRASVSAAATWNAATCADITMSFGSGEGVDDALLPDGVSSVAFIATESSLFENLGSESLALTCYVCDDDGFFVEADVRLDGARHAWSDACDGASWDAEATVLHELGHVLGLSHTPDPQAVMFPVTSARRLLAHRRLGADDVNALCARYPCAAPPCGVPHPSPPPLDCALDIGLCGACTDSCGTAADVCLDAPGEPSAVCGRACSAGFPCPDRFVCAALTDAPDGASRTQCVPLDGCPAHARLGCGCDNGDACEGSGATCLDGRCATPCDGGVACPPGSTCTEQIGDDGVPTRRLCVALPDETPGDCSTPPRRGCACSTSTRPAAPGGFLVGAATVLGFMAAPRRRRAP